jgi:aminoglycoside phosphotransferase (APT) family kinase protein
MSERSEANRGVMDVREAHRIDLPRLEAWMEAHLPGYCGPLSIAQFRGGQSNPTYRLTTPGGSYVLRRKPPGALLAGAHAVDREYRVLAALAGQSFPVPRVHGLCLDEQVIGTPFYVMDMVEGRIFWDADLPELGQDERAACFDAMNDTIARLHAIDPAAAGLGDYGKPGNYFERQIARWSKQYRGDAEAGRVAAMDRLADWLPANIPDAGDETRIIHGDFRCDNMIFDPAGPEVIAVLDWELSTLGHPLADFTYHLMMYRMPSGIFTGLFGLDLDALAIPTEAEYVASYCRRTGRDGIADLDFFIAFNLFRLAAIVHGIKGRIARGTASSAHAGRMAAQLEPLADLAWEQAKRAGATG